MIDTIIAIVVGLLLFIVLPITGLWIRDKLTETSKEELEEYSRRMRDRMQRPDFPGLERHFGHPVPRALIDLHANSEELSRSDFMVAPSNEVPDDNQWFIAFYWPLDLETVHEVWPGCEGLLYFADDGCGNNYLVDPRKIDPPVLFFDHETGEMTEACEKLSTFMSWPRFDPE